MNIHSAPNQSFFQQDVAFHLYETTSLAIAAADYSQMYAFSRNVTAMLEYNSQILL